MTPATTKQQRNIKTINVATAKERSRKMKNKVVYETPEIEREKLLSPWFFARALL